MGTSAKAITWSGLLAAWSEFAKASLALPRNAEGDRWRDAVPDIVAVQAVTLALKDFAGLPDDERALGLDKAEILIRKHGQKLRDQWPGDVVPSEVLALIDDAGRAFVAAPGEGLEWVVAGERLECAHPAPLIDLLVSAGLACDLYVAAPGVPVFQGAPAAFFRAGTGDRAVSEDLALAVGEFLGQFLRPPVVRPPSGVATPRQVYRQFDFGRGGPVRDVVVRMADASPPGQPLLVPVLLRGRAQAVSLPPRKSERLEALPVVDLSEAAGEG